MTRYDRLQREFHPAEALIAFLIVVGGGLAIAFASTL